MEQKKKILVVEDEKYLLEMYSEILRDAGYEVSTAEDGDMGLKAAGEDKFDLIVLDLMMPHTDGMQVLTEINGNAEKYGNPPVIVLTNVSSEVAIKNAFAQKAYKYLMKSELTPQQILDEVKDTFNRLNNNEQAA